MLLLTAFWTCMLMIFTKATPRIDNATYFSQRESLMQEDLSRMIGAEIVLSPDEEIVNNLLMSFKDADMQNGFSTLNFPPSDSFFVVKDQIEQSSVFSIIKNMPKGAGLHLHDSGLASAEWVVSELTYWPDLYMCNQTGNPIRYKFFDTPDGSCPWRSVSEERATYSDPQHFDQLILDSITIITDDPQDYETINDVWNKMNNAFVSIEGLVMYAAAWESYLARLLYEFMMDNIVYIEFRGVLPLLYEKNGSSYNEMETFAIYEKVINEFTSNNTADFFGAKYIYAPVKLSVDSIWNATTTMISLRDNFPDLVAGFDLVGQEDQMIPLIDLIEPILFLANQEPPMTFFYHAGETNWHGLLSDENVFDAILLNSTRIGHAFAITKHPSLLQRIKEDDIAIEVNPISNQVLMLVDDLRNHPMAELAADGFPLVISSDDPAMWGADPLSHDFYQGFYAFGGAKADLRFLKQLAINSIEYSSLSSVQKIQLRNLWQTKWDEFISSTINKIGCNVE